VHGFNKELRENIKKPNPSGSMSLSNDVLLGINIFKLKHSLKILEYLYNN